MNRPFSLTSLSELERRLLWLWLMTPRRSVHRTLRHTGLRQHLLNALPAKTRIQYTLLREFGDRLNRPSTLELLGNRIANHLTAS